MASRFDSVSDIWTTDVCPSRTNPNLSFQQICTCDRNSVCRFCRNANRNGGTTRTSSISGSSLSENPVKNKKARKISKNLTFDCGDSLTPLLGDYGLYQFAWTCLLILLNIQAVIQFFASIYQVFLFQLKCVIDFSRRRQKHDHDHQFGIEENKEKFYCPQIITGIWVSQLMTIN